MAAIQLNFTLRTSSNCKTVHLLGSWDNYQGQLPLSKDPAKSGGWKGTFRFQGSTLQQGSRYWYYVRASGGMEKRFRQELTISSTSSMATTFRTIPPRTTSSSRQPAAS